MSKSKSEVFRVRPGDKFDLGKRNPGDAPLCMADKAAEHHEVERLGAQLDALQDVLYANQRQSLLLVLQGMDTAGKDGTVRAVFNQVNPRGVNVASFKVPTEEEKAHDFLWRVHARTPRAGEVVIFNRSHYEDVLITWVHGWIDDAERKRRIRIINEFEAALVEQGTLIVKCMLHISPKEQKQRLEERIADPNKHWKFNPGDLAERKLWGRYMEAYEHALQHTSTEAAPWWVIPSDSKMHRNLAVATLLVEQLQSLKLSYPPANPDYYKLKIT